MTMQCRWFTLLRGCILVFNIYLWLIPPGSNDYHKLTEGSVAGTNAALGDQPSVTSLGDQPSWGIIDVGLPSPVLRAREDVLKFSMVDNL